MRIVTIGCTHGSHRLAQVPEGDVLIHTGDFMLSGRDYDEIYDFNRWLEGLPHRHKIVIAGNHDIYFERETGMALSILTAAHYLEDSGITIDGINFWGSPMTPNFNEHIWVFNRQRGAVIRRHWDAIPDSTDVLITHGPPREILDQVKPGRKHLGCVDLGWAVQRVKPKLHVFSHIHGGSGVVQIPSFHPTKFVNCAFLNEAYQPYEKPITVTEI